MGIFHILKTNNRPRFLLGPTHLVDLRIDLLQAFQFTLRDDWRGKLQRLKRRPETGGIFRETLVTPKVPNVAGDS